MGTFSWKRAAKHGGVVFLVIVLAGAIVAGTARVADPEKLGEGVGQFAMVATLVAIAISYLVQTGRRRTAWLLGGAVLALVALAVAGIALDEPHRLDTLSAADRAPLVELSDGGARWLRHPTLGFSLRHPGAGYAPSEKLASALAASMEGSGIAWYAYAQEPPREALLLAVMPNVGATRTSLERAVAGIEHGLTASAAEKLGDPGTSSTPEVTWTATRQEAHLHVALANAMQVEIAAHVIHPAKRGPMTAVLMAMGPGEAPLADVLQSFRADAPHAP